MNVFYCFIISLLQESTAYFVYLPFPPTDLALDVKGCSDVYASFDKYVAVERLEGDNKYQSEEHGLQVN